MAEVRDKLLKSAADCAFLGYVYLSLSDLLRNKPVSLINKS